MLNLISSLQFILYYTILYFYSIVVLKLYMMLFFHVFVFDSFI